MKKQLFVLLVTITCLSRNIFPTCPCPFSYLFGWMHRRKTNAHKKNDIELKEILVSPKKPLDPAILEQPFEPRGTTHAMSQTYIPKDLTYVPETKTSDQQNNPSNQTNDRDFTPAQGYNNFPYSDPIFQKRTTAHLTKQDNDNSSESSDDRLLQELSASHKHFIKPDSESSWHNIDEEDL